MRRSGRRSLVASRWPTGASSTTRRTSLEEILDWRPFDYFTIERTLPMPFLKPIRITYELEDTPEGTRLTEYSVPAPGLGQRLPFAVMTRMQAAHMKHAYESLGAALAAATDAAVPA